jgi:hypothetical protein
MRDTKKVFTYTAGFETVLRAELTFDEARVKGFILARQYNKPIQMYAYNEYLYKTEYLGEYNPDGETFVNSFGDTCKLDYKTNNFYVIKK